MFAAYFSAVGYLASFFAFMVYLAAQGFAVSSNIWLSMWSNAADQVEVMSTADRNMYLLVYGALGFSQGNYNSLTYHPAMSSK